MIRFHATIQCPLLKDFVVFYFTHFLNHFEGGCLKEAAAFGLKGQTPRTCIVLVRHYFPSSKLQSLPGWSFPTQLSPWPFSLYHAWNSQRKGGSAADNNVPSLAVIRVLLSGNPPFEGLHCPHPLTSSLPSPPSPRQPTISRLYGNEKLLFFTKKDWRR